MFQTIHGTLAEGDDLRVTVTPRPRTGESPERAIPFSVLATPAELDHPTEGFVTALGRYASGRLSVLQAADEARTAQEHAAAETRKEIQDKAKGKGGKPAATAATAPAPPTAPDAPSAPATPPAPPADQPEDLFTF